MPRSSAKIFRYFLICFVVGIAIASFFRVDYFYLYCLGLVFLVLLILFWRKPFYRFLFFGGFLILSGILRYQISLPMP